MSWGERAAEQREKDQPSEVLSPGHSHPAEMVRIPICATCGQDVVWDEAAGVWVHDE